MTALPQHTSFPARAAETEAELFGDFLSTDLSKVAMAAGRIGDPFWLALVAAPLDGRRAAAESWRGNAIRQAVNMPPLSLGFELLDVEGRAELLAGKVPLGDAYERLSRLLTDTRAARHQARREERGAVKKQLAKLHPNPADVRTNAIPAVAVVLADGAVSLHGSIRSAKDHGRASGQSWVLIPVDRAKVRFHESGDSTVAQLPVEPAEVPAPKGRAKAAPPEGEQLAGIV